MHYDVIVTAEIRQSHNAPVLSGIPAGMNDLMNELMSSRTKIVSEGILRSTRDGRIILSFNSENGQESTISFSKKEPALISIYREDAIFINANTVFLEEGKRHKCISNGKNGEHIEFTVSTTRVDNRLLRSGKMTLEYSIDVCGMSIEAFLINITVVHAASEK